MRAALVVSVVTAAIAACYVGPLEKESGPAGTSTSSTEPPPAPTLEAGAATGLPCEIDALLAKRCRSCHVPGGSGPMPLVTYEDLAAPSKSAPERSVAIRSLERMLSAGNPMPPSGERATSAETTAFQAWIEAGLPRGSCGSDAGATEAGLPEAAPPTTTVCTSGLTWTSNQKGSQMQPGKACITCHEANEDEPIVWVGGTVYPTLHEPNGCYGATEGQVVVTDATGRVITMPVGPTGNFSLSAKSAAALVMPIRAKVVRNGSERVMGSPQSTGNCNECHTEQGANGAPGRILLP